MKKELPLKKITKEDIALITALLHTNDYDKKVLLFLCENMDEHNLLQCSDLVLCERLSMSLPTVKKSIRVLHESGCIDVYRTKSSNIFVIKNEQGLGPKDFEALQPKTLFSEKEQNRMMKE